VAQALPEEGAMRDQQTSVQTAAPEAAPSSASPARRRPFLFEGVALAGVLLCAGGLRVWNIDQNGYGNSYYAAAVRSMLTSGSNFAFGSFDPAGFVTVDKPPVAMWIQAASAGVFGYSGRSLLIPQALIGVASVLLTYLLVRRVAGPGAGLVAGLLVAITPISVAVDRDNLPDSALVLVLLLAAWALSWAVETGRLWPLLGSVALVGVAFNVKMLAAFVVLPTFYLVYLLAAPGRWWRRIGHLTVATLVLAVVSLSWVAVVELTPKDQRPYIGGSKTNSALELAVGYNGLGRIFGGLGNRGPRGAQPGGQRRQGDGPVRTLIGAAAPTPAGDGRAPDIQPAPRPDGDGPPNGFPPGPPPGADIVFPPGPPPDADNDPPPGPPPGADNGAPPRPDGGAGGFRAGGRTREQPSQVINILFSVAGAQGNQAIAAGPVPYLLGVARVATTPLRPRGSGPGNTGFGGPPGGPGFGGPPGRGGFGGAPGVLRFAGAQLAGQITWLIPLALVAVVAVTRFRWRGPANPATVAVFLWTGWLVTHWAVFSWAQGIFHEYYTTVMGPAVAALAAIALTALWRQWFHTGGWRSFLLPVALVLTAAWQVFILVKDFPEARRWLMPTVIAGAGVATLALLSLGWFSRNRWLRRSTKFATGLGVVALLVGPASWSLAVLARPGNAVMPAAPEPRWFSERPDRGPRMPFSPDGQLGRDERLIEFLRANRHEERILVVGPSAMSVAPIIIATGEPAVSLGGFMGADSVVTKDEFVQMVEEGQVRFVFASGPGGPGGMMSFRGPGGGGMQPPGGAMPQGGPGGQPGGQPGGPPGGPGGGPGGQANAEIMTWVREHGKEADSRLWRADEPADGPRPGGPGGRGGPGGPFGRMEHLYDCRPELGLIDPQAR
jgi:4-amino-4-deoxy-L-arabinose transferase-like glycosyltransferase